MRIVASTSTPGVPINFTAQAYWNGVHPNSQDALPYADWTLRLQATLIL